MSVPSLVSQLQASVPGIDPGVRASEFADLQADGMPAAARERGRPPRALAAEVAGLFPAELVARSVVAGPGFINLTVADEALSAQVAARWADPRLGVGRPAGGSVTVVDYSQPNIAKEMHVGHLRSTVIGDALVRVLTHLGGTVVRQNHVGDWGTQFGMLIQYLHEGGDDSAGMYRRARARFDADAGFAARARSRVVALQGGDPGSVAVWQRLVAASTRDFQAVYARLGVLLGPDDVVGESFYNPMLVQVVDELVAAGVAVRSDGAWCVFADAEPAPLIVRKSDGGFGYAATDLAAIRHRVGQLRADRIVYVVDARQAWHFRMVFGAARRAGWLDGQAVHVPFGTVLGADGRPFKTRSGVTVRLEDLLDAAVAHARQVVAGKDPRLAGAELDERARQVGIGAVKYADLSTSRTKDYVFDPVRMMALAGNTATYLQYAHARVRSILARAGEEGAVDRPLEGRERTLALLLDTFGDVLAEVAETYEPHRLANYLYAVAQAFSGFYEHCPVLTGGQRRPVRLVLCRLTGDTLRTGLGLLGIEAPERL